MKVKLAIGHDSTRFISLLIQLVIVRTHPLWTLSHSDLLDTTVTTCLMFCNLIQCSHLAHLS